MIKIVTDVPKTSKIQEPAYLLTYNYMIGDANGDTVEEIDVSLKNPFTERYVTALNKLQPTKGHWGVMLEDGRMYAHLQEGHITQDEYIILQTAFSYGEYDPIELEEFEEKDNPLILSEEDKEFLAEFSEGVRADAEYSFLVFQGANLEYIDEFGVAHQTEFVD